MRAAIGGHEGQNEHGEDKAESGEGEAEEVQYCCHSPHSAPNPKPCQDGRTTYLLYARVLRCYGNCMTEAILQETPGILQEPPKLLQGVPGVLQETSAVLTLPSDQSELNGNVERKNGYHNGKRTTYGVPFTKETSRYAIHARAKRKADAEEIKRQVALAPHKLAIERAEMLAIQIKRTHEKLLKELEPKEHSQMLVALSRLVDQERVLRGIPNPGSYRPTKPRTDSTSGDATPL